MLNVANILFENFKYSREVEIYDERRHLELQTVSTIQLCVQDSYRY